MGDSPFSRYVEGPDLEPAFREALRDAQDENGRGGFSGSLADKNDVTAIQTVPVPFDEAIVLAAKLLEVYDPRVSDKRGPAGAIAVGNDAETPTGWLIFGYSPW